MSLDTLANVKARLGIATSADDALLGLLMDSADAWVALYAGRDFAGGTFTEYFAGGGYLLILSNYPVTGVTSVKVDAAGSFGPETAVDATSYAVEAQRGVIQSRLGPIGPCGPQVVQVVYTTATGAVPNDVKEAYARLIGQWYAHVKTQVAAGFQDVEEQKFGDVTVNYSATSPPPPAEVERLLAPYRTPVI
jgi:uncharacterized phiE125 gp8 family phage protein